MHYFYMLHSDKDKRFYYGSTNDLQRRLSEHQHGGVKATSSRLPVKLVYYEAYQTRKLAQSRERSVKQSQGARQALLSRIF